MKRVLLFIVLLVALVPSISFGQSFSRYKDTVWLNYTGSGAISLYNNIIPLDSSAAGVVLKWKVIACNFPADWVAKDPGICDNNSCFTFSTGIWPTGLLKTTFPYTISTTRDFHMLIDLSGASVVTRGLYFTTVKLYNSANPDDSLYSTFAVSNYPASVPAIKKNIDEVALYPNPTSNDINVTYDAASDIKTISVYNIIGKVMAIYKPLADNSANLSLENVPAGIYFVRLANSQGQVVATKKFTKQ